MSNVTVHTASRIHTYDEVEDVIVIDGVLDIKGKTEAKFNRGCWDSYEWADTVIPRPSSACVN